MKTSNRIILFVLFFMPIQVYGTPLKVFGPLVLGQSCALSGPAQNLGLEMRSGLLAAFADANESGGVHGREIILLTRDDGYEPDKAVRNTKAFIYDDQVFALIGAVGTPTSKAVAPIITDAGIPFFGPFTGAEFLRKPFNKYVINVRASYFQEMEKLASYLVEEKKLSRIACFYQNDSYGFAGLKGIEIALARRSMALVSKGSYERNTVAVMGAMRDIYKGSPEAVVLVGAYSACAEFIKLSKNKYTGDVTFCNISFVGTDSLREALGRYGENVIVSQVVPSPQDTGVGLTREFKRAMAKYQHDAPISFTSYEGFIVGKLFCEIARSVKNGLTRERFIAAMEQGGRFNLNGLVLEYGVDDHQGLDAVYLTQIYPEVEEIKAGN
ncbi:ABC transporter substrate-binding protein [Desulforhopalus sp. IMCC35007]|uniref:ABC transporter substrate-binding protein n=1 Tax=Desulforhopalus sp. IMCC35007 TaxID=2569543 RepID=UPI0010AEC259|nr:ABC transporter substrate-binding protein [Desulforhopalus sp. IMCC35007]TKB06299.1 leucine/isoleucine/valine-binding protein [Desulforhopalus sp. IMCC35007]